MIKKILKGEKNEEKKYPVMVFFHGGAFMLGSGSDAYIDGRSYAQRDTILISVNYRLGSLGFLTYPYINFVFILFFNYSNSNKLFPIIMMIIFINNYYYYYLPIFKIIYKNINN